MKKARNKLALAAASLALAIALSGCAGDYQIREAIVVDKPIAPSFRSPGTLTIEKDGNRYSFRVYNPDFRIAEVGSKVNLSYKSVSDLAEIKPAVK